MNFKRVGKCPNCKQVWQAVEGAWERPGGPRCPDCGGFLVRVELSPSERHEAILDNATRKAEGRKRIAR